MTNKNRTRNNIEQIISNWRILIFSKSQNFNNSFTNGNSNVKLNGYQIDFEYFNNPIELLNSLATVGSKLIIHFNSSELQDHEVNDIINQIRNCESGSKAYIVVWSENPSNELTVNFLQSGKINDFHLMSTLVGDRLNNILYINIKNHEKFIELDNLKNNIEDKINQRTNKMEVALKKNSSVNAKLLKHKNQIDKQNQEIYDRNTELELAFKKSSKQSIKLQKALLQNELHRKKTGRSLGRNSNKK